MRTALRWLCWGFLGFVLIAMLVGQAVKYGIGAVIFTVAFLAAIVGAVTL